MEHRIHGVKVLAQLLLELFNSAELKSLLLDLPRGDELWNGLKPGSPSERSLEAAEACWRRGLVSELLPRILEARPAQHDRILRDRAALGALPPPGPAQKTDWTLPNPLRRLAAQGEVPWRRVGAPEITLLARARQTQDRVEWSFHLPGALQPAFGHETTTGKLGLPNGLRLAELVEALARADTLDPSQRTLPADAPKRIGAALGAWMWGSLANRTALFSRLFGPSGGPQPGPALRPVRLRLDLPDSLAALPWTWLADGEYFLTDVGWTIERAGGDGPPVMLNNPFDVLLIIPPKAGQDLGAELHREQIEGLFRQRWGDKNRSVRAVGTSDELKREAGSFRPAVIYVYGHGVEHDEGAALFLDTATGCAQVQLRALLSAFPHTTAVYLNLPHGPPLHVLSATLDAPLALCGAAESWPAHAATAGLDWLDALVSGGDPVSSALAVGARSLPASRVLPRTRYATWTTARHVPPALEGAARDHLDRSHQKATLRHELSERLLSVGGRSVAIVIAMGDEPQRAHDFSRMAAVYLRGADPDARAPLNLGSVTATAPSFARPQLNRALLNALGRHRGATLQARLEAWSGTMRAGVAPKGMPILWIDWGTVGGDVEFDSDDLERWIRFAVEELAPHCPTDMRAVYFLAVRTDRENHGGLKQVAEDAMLASQPRPVELVVLDPLGDVNLPEITRFLRDPVRCTCAREADPELVAVAIFARSLGGRFDLVVALIEEAERTGWSALQAEGERLRDQARAAAPKPARKLKF